MGKEGMIILAIIFAVAVVLFVAACKAGGDYDDAAGYGDE